jgi:hypothetical protein
VSIILDDMAGHVVAELVAEALDLCRSQGGLQKYEFLLKRLQLVDTAEKGPAEDRVEE